MKKVIEKVEQRGTLLVEAIAMLGLIAMVTPTLYKKSAERLQEIQDINAASQMRTFNQIIETFVKQKIGGIKDELGDDLSVIELVKNDDASGSGVFSQGYSSVMPFGYKTDEIKNYQEPRVFVHFNRKEQDSAGANPTITTYIVYPHISDPGKKRAARLASLVGANGGMVLKNQEFQGTGGAWFLDNSQVTNILEIPTELLTENNVVVTSQEPIEESSEDNVKYLYRVHQDNEPHRNTMITNLYMGGNEEPAQTGYNKDIDDFYSIFNVKKMTLNTNCDYETVKDGNYNSSFCNPAVADLYVGKPFGKLLSSYADGNKGNVPANNGAAWIYGNLSAMNEGFRAWGIGSTRSEFLFKPTYDDSTTANYALIDAMGDINGVSSHVKLMGDFVIMEKNATGYDFVISPGMSSDTGVVDASSYIFYANQQGSSQTVKIGMQKNAVVYVAEQGGSVYINGGSSASETSLTVVNSQGGALKMGMDSDWMEAKGHGNSAQVHMLKNKGEVFTVGGSSDTDALIYAQYREGGSPNDSAYVALNQGRLYITDNENAYITSSRTGGSSGSGFNLTEGNTAITTKYVDIFGRTYIGNNPMIADNGHDGFYTRGYTLGVAGSAWVDEFLWARSSWVGDMGMRNLHAGFSSFASYKDAPETGWLNVYNPEFTDAGMQGGGVVVRNPKLVSTNTFYNEDDVMFLARNGEARLSDTKGASLRLDSSRTFLGYGYSDADIPEGSEGITQVAGKERVNIFTRDEVVESSVVDLQKGAFELYGQGDSTYANKIIANAGKFALRTSSSLANSDEDNVQFLVNGNIARTRDLNFAVQRADSTDVFAVNIDSTYATADSGSANVEMNGSLHVTGNEVIHIASNSSNTAEHDGQRAMFEIDPDYIRVWAKDDNNAYAGSSATDYYAMLKINPHDVSGNSSLAEDVYDTSIYIRKGAIELMGSDSSNVTAADAGFGYILANRLVSNAGQVPTSYQNNATEGTYDQYMVNPAYTSVMHDIKLTTRGGARLSDILPDFVLKGVYNVSNDYIEGSKTKRIKWSAGDSWGDVTDVPVTWSDPYMGHIPFAMCPPGYANMATIVPISFQIGRAGNVVKASAYNGHPTSAEWQIVQKPQQADILEAAISGAGIHYPRFEEIKTFVYNDIINDSSLSSFDGFLGTMSSVTEGWFYGLPGDKNAISSATSVRIVGDEGTQYWEYTDASSDTHPVASPLYFQEGTFLKTSVLPKASAGGWEARMGFIYDTNVWSGLGSGAGGEGIISNNTIDGNNSEGGTNIGGGNYVWNLFPVPTNTLEGHATVYCYFDRTKFGNHEQVQQLDMLNSAYDYSSKTTTGAGSAEAYMKRLHDPSLKYSDPW